MDAIDRRLLDILQHEFPLVSRPYQRIGEQVGISEQETIDRIKSLFERNLVRKLGAFIAPFKIGYKSTLIAMRVPEESIDDLPEFFENLRGITHVYQRDHRFNVWFTFIYKSESQLHRLLDSIEKEFGISDILNLPQLNRFKVDARFDIQNNDD